MARKQVIFWLDDGDPLQAEMIEYTAELKQQRSFAQTIRDGLRLIRDLRQGRTEVLLQLFPWVADHFTPQPPPPPHDPSSGGKVLQEINHIKDILLQHSVASGFVMARQQPAQLPASIGHPMNARTPHEPKAAADLIEVKNAASDGKSGWNALISMAALQGTFDGLPADVRAYGIEIGRIPVKATKTPQNKPHKALEAQAPKPLKEFKPLPAPALDDLDLASIGI